MEELEAGPGCQDGGAMFLTISTTHRPATDLGYLLHKNPARAQQFRVGVGTAHVFYPEVSDERCTAALLVDVDPLDLVRRRRARLDAVDQYVNDRPYAASSYLAVALGEVFGTAMAGRCRERPELAETPLPLRAVIAALPSSGGEAQIRRLFEPLGYAVGVHTEPLEPAFSDWGPSPYHRVTLEATTRLAALLTHLAVLIPVLDGTKHYWVGDDEVDKLLRRGEGWLHGHPERAYIVSRYLKRRGVLTRQALERLAEEDQPDVDATQEEHDAEEEMLEERVRLSEQRMDAVLATLRSIGATRVVDVGCGEGKLLSRLLADGSFTDIAGMDVSIRALERAAENLHLDRLAPMQRKRISLFQGSLTYRDERLRGYDAATAVEVIEHLDPSRLDAFSRVLFEHAKPRHVVVTTPNSEYNAVWEALPAGRFRHADHRFEWTRQEFRGWSEVCADRAGYGVRFLPIGPEHPQHGAPTQMAVFSR
jgi:3' terminal RNA ribose 2'-O-methyltransferase Hen1